MSTELDYSFDDIIGHECKHVTYTEAAGHSTDDLLTIKEKIHLKDGRIIPHLRFKKNYDRQFAVTKEGCRDHKDKKEWESRNKVQFFKTTQRNMLKRVGEALGRGPIQGGMQIAARSPYLYASDITTPTLMKNAYQKKWPQCVSDNDVAVFDIESDMINQNYDAGGKRPIMMSLTFKDKAVLVVVRSFVSGIANPEAKIQAKFTELLGDIQKERKIDLIVRFADKPGEATKICFEYAHLWKPDIVAVWNINFDLPMVLSALEEEGYDPADVFSDPSVPTQFRYFNYKVGKSIKVTSSGKTMSLHPAEQWHVVTCPASFYFLDAMCVYLKIRIAKGKDSSYALDHILAKHGCKGKLKFEEANAYTKGQWHTFMQKYHKVEYCVYNLFDSISMELLDDKTTDLKRTVSLLCGPSEYSRFPSQPRRTCDDLHFFCEERGLVIASTSDQMETELDSLVVDISDWIVTLDSYLMDSNGLKCLEELPNVATQLRAHNADLDIEGTYPTEEMIFNVSKETTKRELSAIAGITEDMKRRQGINLTAGPVNAVEICTALYKAPTFGQLLEGFKLDKGIPL
jgi:hypothetical protein